MPGAEILAADGIYGSSTKKAVRQYQLYSGLYADGITGEKTWNSIMEDYSSLPVPARDIYPGYPLRPGTAGAAVSGIQTKLNMLSSVYTAINSQISDGKYGNNTSAAVKLFQRQFGLVADGITGQKTWDKINTVYRDFKEGKNTGVESRYPGYVLTRGHRNDSVRFIQSYLNHINQYYNYRWPVLAVDGIYGRLTAQAVTAFQTEYSLKADGKTGSATWEKLVRELNSIL